MKSMALFCGTGWGIRPEEGFLLYPDSVIEAYNGHEVIPVLQEVQKQTDRGNIAFGFIAYEAAGAFGLPVFPPLHSNPLLWFGIAKPHAIEKITLPDFFSSRKPLPAPSVTLSMPIDFATYSQKIHQIQQWIGKGDTYQINFTIRTSVETPGSGLPFFIHLFQSQPVPYAAYLQWNDQEIHCLSPELFLQKRGNQIETRPMKGTRHRGLTHSEDLANREELNRSEKDHAENIMILDMARNDLGRICQTGSISARDICRIESYRSLFQMTSMVSGTLRENISWLPIVAATFPAASITGAPKQRTMEFIRELEKQPRGVYCGSIGMLYPSGDFIFNVAIRTLHGNPGRYTLGVGGGIVWDSSPELEYQEVQTKSDFVQCAVSDFSLIETIRLQEDRSYGSLHEHLDRLRASAAYWDISFDYTMIHKVLQDYAKNVSTFPTAVRLVLDSWGRVQITHRPPTVPPARVRVRIIPLLPPSDRRFLFHKTTHRAFYDRLRKEGLDQGFFETVFLNEKDHITEGAISNFFCQIEGHWYTPPLEDQLLPGIWRMKMIREKNAHERLLTLEDIKIADEILIGNSVIGSIHVDEIFADSVFLGPHGAAH